MKPTFEQLVDRARGGDASAQSAVLEQLEPMLRGYFIRRIGRHTEVDDLVQNTLLRIFRAFTDLKESARIRPFALKAALFELQDLYRGRYGSREVLRSPDDSDPASEAAETGTLVDVDRALASLTPHARRILELKILGYRYEEIATQLDTTEAAVKMQVKRAVARLRDILLTLLWWIHVTF